MFLLLTQPVFWRDPATEALTDVWWVPIADSGPLLLTGINRRFWFDYETNAVSLLNDGCCIADDAWTSEVWQPTVSTQFTCFQDLGLTVSLTGKNLGFLHRFSIDVVNWGVLPSSGHYISNISKGRSSTPFSRLLYCMLQFKTKHI